MGNSKGKDVSADNLADEFMRISDSAEIALEKACEEILIHMREADKLRDKIHKMVESQSAGYIRRGSLPKVSIKNADIPNPVTDDWVESGKDRE